MRWRLREGLRLGTPIFNYFRFNLFCLPRRNSGPALRCSKSPFRHAITIPFAQQILAKGEETILQERPRQASGRELTPQKQRNSHRSDTRPVLKTVAVRSVQFDDGVWPRKAPEVKRLARIAMIAITTMSSISVNASFFDCPDTNRFISVQASSGLSGTLWKSSEMILKLGSRRGESLLPLCHENSGLSVEPITGVFAEFWIYQ